MTFDDFDCNMCVVTVADFAASDEIGFATKITTLRFGAQLSAGARVNHDK
jgi:hypothetical protein